MFSAECLGQTGFITRLRPVPIYDALYRIEAISRAYCDYVGSPLYIHFSSQIY